LKEEVEGDGKENEDRDKTYIFRGKKVRGYPLLEKEHTAKGK